MELKPITITFAEPINGYWDGGKKSGGTFEPQLRFQDDPDKSYVKWDCWELNHYFNFPLHYEKGLKKGQPLSTQDVIRKAKAILRKSIRIQATIK